MELVYRPSYFGQNFLFDAAPAYLFTPTEISGKEKEHWSQDRRSFNGSRNYPGENFSLSVSSRYRECIVKFSIVCHTVILAAEKIFVRILHYILHYVPLHNITHIFRSCLETWLVMLFSAYHKKHPPIASHPDSHSPFLATQPILLTHTVITTILPFNPLLQPFSQLRLHQGSKERKETCEDRQGFNLILLPQSMDRDK